MPPQVNQDPRRLERYELLAGGASGSSAFRLAGLVEPSVLKVKPTHSLPYARQRAQREIEFYRTQAAGAAVPVDATVSAYHRHQTALTGTALALAEEQWAEGRIARWCARLFSLK